MRLMLLTIGWLLLGSAAEAQQLAQVRTVAHVRVPDFLILKTGQVTETTHADGKQVRRVTLYVTANREWNLTVAKSCSSGCSAAAYTVSKQSGRGGNDHEVVVEYVWGRGERAPRPEEFQYLLVGA